MYTGKLLVQILDKKNLDLAIKRVKQNKGKPGIDGMTIHEVKSHFVRHEDEIRQQIMKRKYKPSPVLRVEIPKPNGGKRLLGIPTVTDRVIQQAIAQVLTPIFEETFSEYSYGFRPNKRAEMAITKSIEYMNEGFEWVVDIDLERFFDTVNHDRLMNLISRKIDDGDVISLIRKYLVSGIQIEDKVEKSVVGTPQGGNLSPLLSNIMLNELDKELENRNLRFVRYADDCVIFAKSEMAARRIMRSTTKFIEEKLGLIVNAEKSKVIRPNKPDMKYLGFGFYKYDGKYKAKPHKLSYEKLKWKMKQLTQRKWSIKTKDRVKRINETLRGWINYFRICDMKTFLGKIDSNTRFRLRMCIWKQWKTPKNRQKHLRTLGMHPNEAYKNSNSSKAFARIANSWVLTTTITNKRLEQFGLLSGKTYLEKVHV